jgi:transcriptional regulator with XRE-family HTH domain
VSANPFQARVEAKRWLSAEIGRRVRAARELGGWSQDDVAAETSFTRSHLANLEAGHGAVPSLEALYELAASLGISAKGLLP